jgi:SEL1 protein
MNPAIKAGIARSVGETWEDVLEYYSVSILIPSWFTPTYSVGQFNADRGETDFAYRLGKIFYQGSIYHAAGGIASGSEGVGRVPRNFHRARHYFEKIARNVWPRDPQNPLQHAAATPKEEGVQIGYAAASAAYLGRMYLRGEGVRQDPIMARMWFERGSAAGDRECHNGLGVIWRDGLVHGQTNEKRALAFFNAAAAQELAEAQVNLGKFNYSEFHRLFSAFDQV